MSGPTRAAQDPARSLDCRQPGPQHRRNRPGRSTAHNNPHRAHRPARPEAPTPPAPPHQHKRLTQHDPATTRQTPRPARSGQRPRIQPDIGPRKSPPARRQPSDRPKLPQQPEHEPAQANTTSSPRTQPPSRTSAPRTQPPTAPNHHTHKHEEPRNRRRRQVPTAPRLRARSVEW